MAQGVATCEELQRELSAYLDGALSAEKAARLARHLEECGACRARYESEQAVVARLKQVKAPPVPPELRRRILKDLHEEDERANPPES